MVEDWKKIIWGEITKGRNPQVAKGGPRDGKGTKKVTREGGAALYMEKGAIPRRKKSL